MAKVNFKAGKMIYENNKVRPDLRKGEISIITISDLTHFQ